MVTVCRRHGHSLVELIVAMTFLCVTLSAIAAGGILAVQRTHAAMRVQEAAALAAAVLDSVMATLSPASGARDEGPILVQWQVEAVAEGWSAVEVRAVHSPTGAVLALLNATWAPPPILAGDSPDASSAGSPVSP